MNLQPDADAQTTVMVDVRMGEVVKFSGPADIEPIQKSGHRVRLRVTAPRATRIEKPAHSRPESVASVR